MHAQRWAGSVRVPGHLGHSAVVVVGAPLRSGAASPTAGHTFSVLFVTLLAIFDGNYLRKGQGNGVVHLEADEPALQVSLRRCSGQCS